MIKVVEVLPKAKALDKLERARMFAYSLYEKRGGALGNKSQGWLNAETNAEKIKESQEKYETAKSRNKIRRTWLKKERFPGGTKMKKYFLTWLLPLIVIVSAAGCNNSPTAPATTPTTGVNTATITRTSTQVINTPSFTRTSTQVVPTFTSTLTIVINTATFTSTMTSTETSTETATQISTETPTETSTAVIVLPTATVTQTATTAPVFPVVVLGAASSFAVFGGTAGTTNSGIDTRVNGDVGTTGASTLVTGFHDSNADIYTETTLNIGEVTGLVYCDVPAPGSAGKLVIAQQAWSDASAAYNYLVGLSAGPDPGAGELGGLVLTPGTYTAAGGTFGITLGDLTLDAQGNSSAVFVFQMATTLTVGQAAQARSITLVNSANAANVYWQVGSSAVINAAGGGTMEGTIICNAGTAVSTAGNAALTVINGRVLSLGASVTLVNSIITAQ